MWCLQRLARALLALAAICLTGGAFVAIYSARRLLRNVRQQYEYSVLNADREDIEATADATVGE
jgi:hypothetical protein